MEIDLKLIKKECQSNQDCEGCPFDGCGCNLDMEPIQWDLRKINAGIRKLKAKN